MSNIEDLRSSPGYLGGAKPVKPKPKKKPKKIIIKPGKYPTRLTQSPADRREAARLGADARKQAEIFGAELTLDPFILSKTPPPPQGAVGVPGGFAANQRELDERARLARASVLPKDQAAFAKTVSAERRQELKFSRSPYAQRALDKLTDTLVLKLQRSPFGSAATSNEAVKSLIDAYLKRYGKGYDRNFILGKIEESAQRKTEEIGPLPITQAVSLGIELAPAVPPLLWEGRNAISDFFNKKVFTKETGKEMLGGLADFVEFVARAPDDPEGTVRTLRALGIPDKALAAETAVGEGALAALMGANKAAEALLVGSQLFLSDTTPEQRAEINKEISAALEKGRGAEFARDWIVGPYLSEYLEGESDFGVGTGIDMALILVPGLFFPARPFVAAARAGTLGLKALPRGARIAFRAAEEGYTETRLAQQAGQAVLGPYIPWLGRQEKQWRTPLASELGLMGPAAKARTTGWIEDKILDPIRRQGTPLTRGMRAWWDPRRAIPSAYGKGAWDLRQSMVTRGRLYDWPVTWLAKQGSKLKPEEMYVLRAMASGDHPTERAAFHVGQAAEMAGDPTGVYLHAVHRELNEAAAQFVHIDPETGHVVLNPTAPARIQTAFDAYVRAYGSRERLYVDLGILTEEMIRDRIQATGKIMKGGRWMANEVWAQQEIALAPGREKIVEMLQDVVGAGKMTPQDVTDAMTLADGAARSWYQRERRRTRDYAADMRRRIAASEDEGTLELLMENLLEAELRLDTLTPAEFYEDVTRAVSRMPRILQLFAGENVVFQRAAERGKNVKTVVDKVLGSKVKLPPELRKREDLEDAAHRVFSLAERGAEHRDWYDRAANSVLEVSRITGESPEKVAELFAIFSQAADVVVNTSLVKTALMQWRKYGDVFTGRFPVRQSEDALKVFRGEKWGGQKRNAFFQNIIEKINPSLSNGKAVTVDRHVVSMFVPGKKVPGSYYGAFENLIQEMAATIGWKPKEFQGAVWATFKADAAKLSDKPVITEAGDAFEYGVRRYFVEAGFDVNTAEVTHPETGRILNRVRKPNEGATLFPDLLDAKPTGYVASYGAYELRVLPSKKRTPSGGERYEYNLKPTHLEKFRDEHSELFKDPRARLGLWNNEGDRILYVDISREFKSKAAALRFAREQGQLAVYDAKTGDDILTGLTVEEADAIKMRLREDGRGVQTMSTGRLEGDDDFIGQVGFDYPGRGGYAAVVGRAGPGDPELYGLKEQGFDPWGGFVFHGESPARGRGGIVYGVSERFGDTAVAAHEFEHYLEKFLTYRQLATLERHLGAGGEDLVEAWETWVLMGPRNVHPELREPFARIRQHLIDELPRWRKPVESRPLLDPEVIDIFEAVYNWTPLKGGRIRGAEHTAGVAKEPFRPGMPLPLRRSLGNAMTWIRANRRLASGQPIGNLAVDREARKAMKGYLLLTGGFEADVLKSATHELYKATRIARAMETRHSFLPMARDIPVSAYDIPMKRDPSLGASPELRRYTDLIRDIDGEATLQEAFARSRLGRRELESFHNEAVDEAIEAVFPTRIDGVDARQVAARLMSERAEAIPNIVWVPREFVVKSGVLEPPFLQKSHRSAIAGIVKSGMFTVDAMNDLMRLTLLYLNPAYYPMNALGNLAMNLLHQGPFAAYNLPRAARLSHNLGEEWASLIDVLMGEGWASIAQIKSAWVNKRFSATLSDIANILVDRIPRRAAWLHEALRQGYRTPDELQGLLRGAVDGDRDAQQMVELITRLAKDEIVDFDNLSQFEREFVSRIIFVYPWLKGSTRYTLRFPMNHPAEAMGMGFLFYRQQQRLDEEVGPTPDYLDLWFPITKVNRYGEQYPYGFSFRQMFTQSTTFDIAKALAGFVQGDISASPLSEFMMPMYSLLMSRTTGFDPFLEKKVPRGLWPLISQAAKDITLDSPLGQAIQRSLQSEEDRRRHAEEGRLYPTNRFDDILKIFLGSLAPRPVNPETARRRAREGQAASTEQKIDDFIDEVTKAFGEPPPPEIVAIEASKARYTEIQKEVRRELGSSSLGDYGVALSRVFLLWEVKGIEGDKDEARRELQGLSDEELRFFSANVSKQLDWENPAYRFIQRTLERADG